jgi:hypothetical protein
MGNFPQEKWSKQKWGTFHKRDDQNKNWELSASEMIKTKMGDYFPQETLLQYKKMCLPGFGLAQLDGLGNLSLPGDGLGGHGGPGPLVRRDQLTPAAGEQINQPNIIMKVVGKN